MPQPFMCTSIMKLAHLACLLHQIFYSLQYSWGLLISFIDVYWIKLHWSFLFVVIKHNFQIPVKAVSLMKHTPGRHRPSHGPGHHSASRFCLFHGPGLCEAGSQSLESAVWSLYTAQWESPCQSSCLHCHLYAKQHKTIGKSSAGLSREGDSTFHWVLYQGCWKWPRNNLGSTVTAQR